jgi:hypothetical protein
VSGGKFEVDSTGACVDVNECLTNNGGCAQICNNALGSFDCDCMDGYFLAGDGFSCESM